MAAAAIPTCQQKLIIISGDIISERKQNAISVLEGKASAAKPLGGGVDTLLIKLCASQKCELTEQVPYRSAALRITDKENLTCSITVKANISITRIANKQRVSKPISGDVLLILLVALGDMLTLLWVAKQATRKYHTS